jgi:hypothetical protein
MLLAVATAAGCSGDASARDDQGVALAHLKQRSEQIGHDLVAQLDGRAAADQEAPESKAVSSSGDSSSEGAPSRWSWDARVRLKDYADRTPAQEATALADHLTSEGWQQGTTGTPGTTAMYRSDDDGAWEVDLVTPAQHTLDVVVLSPVTTNG